MQRFTASLILLVLTGIGNSGLHAQSVYEIRFPNPGTHYIEVEAKYGGVGSDSVDVKMAVWTPGSYMVREYSRNVEGFEAIGADGKPLKVMKVRKNTWRVYNGFSRAITCKYRVYANELNVRSCFVDADQVYINGAGLYMYTDELKYHSATVMFHPHATWKNISCGLSMYGPDKWTRTAADFDELVDAPVVIGNHDVFTFDYKGIPHHVAMVGAAKYDSIKIKNDFYRIVHECTKIFGENPNKEYTFIIHNTPSGGGGLEHRNSTSVMTARSTYENEKAYKGLLSLVAHEYFHLWIIKRVRPIHLGPFDYDNEVYTRQLWFFEGFTSFYDDYITYRAGFLSEQEYLDAIKTNVQTVLNTPGDKIQPVSEASFDAWIKYYRQNENSKNATVSYYTKGSVIAAVLYLDFLNQTNGARSLDTLMSYLYNEYYKAMERGLTDAELLEFFEIFGEKEYDDFFAKYINGTEEIPFEQYFNLAGLRLKRVDGMKKAGGYLGAALNPVGNKLIVTQVERNSPAWNNGISANDEITSIDNREGEKAVTYIAEKDPGNVVTVKLLRAGLPVELTVTLGEPVTREFVWENVEKPSEAQKLVRQKWLGR